MRIHAWVVAIAGLLGLSHVNAQNPDVGKALGGLFQGLMNAAPANNAPNQNSAPANALGGLLGIGSSKSNAPAQNNNVLDLVGLLSQSLEQIDEPKEIEIGRQLSAVLLGAKPLHPNMALQRYVNRLGRWIALQSARPNLPWTFAVLDDQGFNAFATPGGYIFITKGLVDHVGDEAELAGILAHEITHVVGKHHLKAMQKTARAGLLTRAVASQLSNNLAGGLSSQLLSLGREMYSKGLDQDDELDADRSGVVLSARAGFDPYGLVAVLQQLRSATVDDSVFALSLSTHPPAQVRLDQLEVAMGDRLDVFSGKPSVTIAQRLTRFSSR
jgi:predicted Zn-dependent protease